MKRTATTLILLAGLGGGGCVSSDTHTHGNYAQTTHRGGFGTVTRGQPVPSVQGPLGEPVMQTQARGATPGVSGPSGVMPAGGAATLIGEEGVFRPVGAWGSRRLISGESCTNCSVPGIGGRILNGGGRMPADGYGMPDGYGKTNIPYDPGIPAKYGPQMPHMPRYGILPVPGQGVPGAVAAYGALMPGQPGGMMSRPGVGSGRTSINFTGPAGMKITWQLPDGNFNDEKDGLTAPKEYNFVQGQVYRLRLTQILPDFPGRAFYPTLEVAPATPKTLTFLSHSSVPITFTADDFAQAKAGNLVVKVVYLPDPANQDFSTIIGAEEIVSTRLEPGADPIAEAQRRGTILAIVRMGNIDLENKSSPPMTAPPPGTMPPGGMPLPGPKPLPNSGLGDLPQAPLAPLNPPGTATVNPPVSLPLPPQGPTDLPPAPLAPLPPAAPKAK